MITSMISTLLFNSAGRGRIAPEFIGKEWINASRPIRMADRRGKVTLVYFWTFACYNCKNNLPAIQNLTDTFKKDGVETISIHTPEISEERNVENVKKAVEKHRIKYPVLIDGSYANWKAWGNNVWPCLYVVDKLGNIRGIEQGELNYGNQNGVAKVSGLIRKLLKED